MAKRVEQTNVETGEKEYKWSRKQPAPIHNGTQYMLARVENEAGKDSQEETFNVILTRDVSTGRMEVLHRRDGKPVQVKNAAAFEAFLDAKLSD